jgi:hypothetical protein
MTFSFKELEEKMKELDYEQDEVETVLSPQNIEDLKKEISNFSDETLYNAERIFSKYYCLSVPKDMIKKLLADDVWLAYEVYTDGIGDTCQREILIDAFLSKIGMRPWPLNGESDAVQDLFIKTLKEKTTEFGFSTDLVEENA